MKISKMLTALAVVVLLLNGCASKDKDRVIGDKADATSTPSPTPKAK